jgi:tetratricopeptide (TPR) repeat protein
MALHAGQADAAARHAAEAVDLSEEAADLTSLALAWTVRSQLALLQGAVEAAASCLDRGQAANDAVDDPWHHGLAAMLRSLAAALRGDVRSAEREAIAAIDALRLVGDVSTLVPVLLEYSRILQSDGRIEAAEAAAREAGEVSESLGLRGWRSTSSSRLGSLAVLRGEHNVGAQHYRAAADLAHELALPHAELAALKGLALAYGQMGDDASARRCHDAARALATRVGRAPELDDAARG